MPRIPLAGQSLIRQVVEAFPDTEVGQSDLDGLEVYRTLTFRSDDAVEWLVKGDLALLLDKRVISAETKGKTFVVTFVADPRADYVTPFPISEVADMSEDMPDKETQTKPKKKAAKPRPRK